MVALHLCGWRSTPVDHPTTLESVANKSSIHSE
jgi:hypothetical protein